MIRWLGLIFLIVSLSLFAQRIFFLKNAQTTVGEVVDVNLATRTDIRPIGKWGETTAITYPKVAFTINDHTYTIDGSTIAGILNLNNYRVLQKVEVVYNIKNPNEAFIYEFSELWAFPLLLLSLAGVFLFLIPLLIKLIIKI